MSIKEMVDLIETVWSDSMSDNGAIWEKSNAELEKAKALHPETYSEALSMLYEKRLNLA
jgi:hypothetical protein